MFWNRLLYVFYLNFCVGFEQETYVDQTRKIAASLSGNGNIPNNVGVEMTGGGADNIPDIIPGKTGESILSIASKSAAIANTEGFKILLQQAEYEMHRGSSDVALEYLNKAVKVRTRT